MQYRRDLDGIRALAVLAVVASHAGFTLTGGGWVGVDLFFVLSGYLITALLLAEHAGTGAISLGRFYMRRALRLYPALLLMIGLGFLFYKQLGDDGTLLGYGRTAAFSGLYLEDFVAGFTGDPHGSFGHTWSLGIEEQFYLLWPLVLVWLLARNRDPLRWAVVGTLASWAAMIAMMGPVKFGLPYEAYFLPWARFSQLLVGCALAIIMSRGRAPRAVSRNWFGWAAAATCTAIALVAGRASRDPHLAWEAPAIALAGAALIWHLGLADGRLRRLLGAPPLAYLGRRSYGIYLFHLPVLDLVTPHTHVRRALNVPITLVITLVLAVLSYRFVERPFLRLKHRRFEPPSHRPEPVPT